MEEHNNRGLRRLMKAFWYSMAGLKAAWKNEEAFRLELVLTVIIIPAGLWLGTTFTQRAMLISLWLIVLVVELINSAIEAIVDRMGPDHHTLSGKAKDLGSAAVFVILCVNLIVWVLIGFERFSH